MAIHTPSLNIKWAIRIALGMFVLNADLILIGLIYFNLTSWLVAFWVTLFISLPEIPIWYWVLNHIFMEYVETGKEAIQEARRKGYFYFNKEYWKQKFEAIKSPKSWHVKLLIKLIKVFGIYGLFAISSEPFPFGRTFTITFCVIARWPAGLIPIMVGNVLHLYWAAALWNNFFN